MAFLCATQALARAAGWPAEPRRVTVDETVAGAALGVWYLDLVHCRGAKLVLAVETGTRWSFVLPAAPFASLADRFGAALFEALLAAGVPPDRARQEVEAASPYVPARLTDRSVQAHLRQCKEDVAWAAQQGASVPLLNERLGHRPILAPRESWTDSELLRKLGGDPELPMRQAREQALQRHEAYAAIKAQHGSAMLRLPVAQLLHTDRLEAAYQADVLFTYVPVGRILPGAPEVAMPAVLVLELRDIHSVSPPFLHALAQLAASRPGLKLVIEGAEPEVAPTLR